jgi:hypothetical protein
MRLKIDITKKPYKKGKPPAQQLDFIANYIYDNLNELEVHFAEMKRTIRNEDVDNAEPEEYLSLLSFGTAIISANAPKKIVNELTIHSIVYNYVKFNLPKLTKQFEKRKKHNCVHNWINFQCCSLLKEWEDIGTESMEEKYYN